MKMRSAGMPALVALVALTLTGAVAVAAKPAPGPAAGPKPRTVALGVSMPDGRDLRQLDAFTRSIGGQKPATWTIWSQWGRAATSAFPMAAAKDARKRGAVPLIWWEPVDPAHLNDSPWSRHQNISDGLYDAYIRSFASDAKRFKNTVLLRFAHEANGSQFPWTVGWSDTDDNTPASFVAAWRHVRDIFRSVGANNVKFVWSMAKKACPAGQAGCNPYLEYYPGDDAVDYMAFSSFNWGAAKEGWIPMLDGYTRVTANLAAISAKPIIAVETASNAEGGDAALGQTKPLWVSEGYPAVYAALPQIVAIVYLNVDLRSAGDPDWRLDSPPEALEAYADIASRPEFKGRFPGA